MEAQKIQAEVQIYRGYEKDDRDFAKYFQILFPTIKEVLDERLKQDGFVSTNPSVMISLVGLSVPPVVLSVLAQKPKELYFVFTEQSERFRALLIKQIKKYWENAPDPGHETVVESSDAVEIYSKITDIWQRTGVEAEDVALDITGGKKTMAGGAFAAASIYGFKIWYVDSEYDDDGRLKHGTEHYHSIFNPMEVFSQKDMQNAQELFDNCHYEAAHKLLWQALDNFDNDDFSGYIPEKMRIEVEKLAAWAECYMHWDNMEYAGAKAVLERDKLGSANDPQYRLLSILAPLREKQEGIEGKPEAVGNKALEQMFAGDEGKGDGKRFAFCFALDMYLSALRRQKQGNYDDAIIRMLRSVDICTQYSDYKIGGKVGKGILSKRLNKLRGSNQRELRELYKDERLDELRRLRNRLASIHNITAVGNGKIKALRPAVRKLLREFGSDHWQSLWGVDDFDDLECLLQFRRHEKIYCHMPLIVLQNNC